MKLPDHWYGINTMRLHMENGAKLAERQLLNVLREAVNDSCTCGGRGPDDPDCCPACSVWHLVMEHDD